MRPPMARLRARCAWSFSPLSATRDAPALVGLPDLDSANVLETFGHAFAQEEADGEIFEVARRRHHHHEG